MSDLDVLITGGRIVDGTGNPWFWGDVGIRNGRIAAVASPRLIDPTSAREVVLATGHVVCPGFIDIQSHSLIQFLSDGRSLSKVTQGVTTEILGEGWTPAPRGGCISDSVVRGFVDVPDELKQLIETWTRFSDWLDHMGQVGISVNYGSFLGGGTLREHVKGWELGEPSLDELELMRGLVRDAMSDGAFGVATALIYPPSAYATDKELYEICHVLAEVGGVYATHMRSESDELLEALLFTLDLGRRTGCAIELYHLKAAGRENWSKMPRAIELIDAARADGIDVTAGMYPYDAGCTGLAAALPPWASAGGRLLENLADAETRQKIRRELLEPGGGWEPLAKLSGPEGVLVTELTSEANRQFSNHFLSEIAVGRGQHWTDCLIDLIIEEQRSIFAVYFGHSESNLTLQLRQPWIKVSTDANGIDPASPGSAAPHPRAYGTYPRVLRKYVREEGVLTLEDAIRKMTSAVSDRLGLRDRGLVREGMWADMTVFDPEGIADHATYEQPHQLSAGVRDVWVNGERVLREGRHTGATPGRPVYGSGRP